MKQRFLLILISALTFATGAYAQDVNQRIMPKQNTESKQEIFSFGKNIPQKNENTQFSKRKQKKIEKTKLKNEKRRQKYMTKFSMIKTKGESYVVGFSLQLGDSVIYLTEINQIDSLKIQRKTKFLPHRGEVSLQLKQYLEGTLGMTNMTTCVFYAKKPKALTKKIETVRKRYSKNGNFVIKTIPLTDFKFKHPLDLINTTEEDEN